MTRPIGSETERRVPISVSLPLYLKDSIDTIVSRESVTFSFIVDRALRMYLRCMDSNDEDGQNLIDRFWIEHPPSRPVEVERKKITPDIVKITRAHLENCSFVNRPTVGPHDTFQKRVDEVYRFISEKHGVDVTELRDTVLSKAGERP